MANIGGFLSALGQMYGGLAQDRKNAEASQLHRVQMDEIGAQAAERRANAQKSANLQQALIAHWKNAQAGDPDAQAAIVAVAPQLGSLFQAKPVSQPKRTYDANRGAIVDENTGAVVVPKGLPPRQEAPVHDVPITTTNPDGTTTVTWANPVTHKETPTTLNKPTSGGGATADLTKARIATASNQATSAHQQMSAFEDKVLAGQANISAMGIAAAKIALSGGPAESAAAELALNKLNPELAQYIRSAKTLATAERLITPRGGSNAMMQAEGMLSAAGPSATKAQILQAREYRQALISGLQSHTQPVGQPSHAASPAPTHAQVSDADFARAWKAGKRSDADIATWVAANPARP